MGSSNGTATNPPVAETTFYVLTSDDGGRTWTFVCEQEASQSAQALRRFFKDNPETSNELLYVSVSGRAFRPKKRNAKVVTTATIADAKMPTVIVAEPEPELHPELERESELQVA